ncbi:hypothetical protein ACFL3R_00720 [Thermodesulfobacteriota bacterium]
MFITNESKLPDIIVRAVSTDHYHPLGDISASSAANPIQQTRLRELHHNELVEDASSRIYSFLGTGVHAFLANIDSPNCIKERSYVHVVNDWLVSCTIDLYEHRKLYDFKVTSVYAAKKVKPEHEIQMNIQRYLMFKRSRIPVERLHIVCILRDWSKMQVMKRGAWDYPKQQVVMQDVPVWSIDQVEEYLKERIVLRKYSRTITNHEELYKRFPCTPEETWEKKSVFAVMHRDRKSALRGGLHDSMEDAKHFLKNLKDKSDKHYIETRRGEMTRCLHYCDVRNFCEQFKKES